MARNKEELTGKKGGPVPATVKQHIISELEQLIELGAIHGLTNSQLAKQFKVQSETISKYLDEAYKKINPDDIQKVYLDFKALFDRLFREAYIMLENCEKDWQKEKVMRLILTLIKEKTDILERFFKKPKAVDNINLNAQVDNKIEIEIVHTNKQMIDVE